MGYSAWSSYSYNNFLSEETLKKMLKELYVNNKSIEEVNKEHNEKEIKRIKETNNENSNQFEVIGKRQIEL